MKVGQMLFVDFQTLLLTGLYFKFVVVGSLCVRCVCELMITI